MTSARFSRRELLQKATVGAGLSAVLPASRSLGSPRRYSAFEPTSRYQSKEIDGWTTRIGPQLRLDHTDIYDEVVRLLDVQLYQIKRVVPVKALTVLQTVTLWIEWEEPHHPCMVFHPDAGWLREHSMNPEKAGCVEIANAKNFLRWTLDQPWMALHELAHAYHHRILGFENVEVKAAYDTAVKAGAYESVLRYSGRKERHYALTDPHEYFAECSEAYFGTNDFYPFVRAEFKAHDPTGYKMIEKLWGVTTS